MHCKGLSLTARPKNWLRDAATGVGRLGSRFESDLNMGEFSTSLPISKRPSAPRGESVHKGGWDTRGCLMQCALGTALIPPQCTCCTGQRVGFSNSMCESCMSKIHSPSPQRCGSCGRWPPHC